MVTPFGPSLAWVRQRLGHGDTRNPVRIEGKEFSRCRIWGRTLTVPVEGGASTLKRKGSEPRLSEHGKWRREHLGAWQAAYGRTPYYAHLMPEIEAVYAESEQRPMTLEEFNTALLTVAMQWIDRSVTESDDPTLTEVRMETRREADEHLSIFDLIFRLGKRASFAI